MRVLRKVGQVVLCNIGVAMIPPVLMQVFRQDATLRDVGKHFQFSLVFTFCIGMPAWWAMERLGPRLRRLSRFLRIPLLVAMLAAWAVVGSLAANLIFVAVGWQNWTHFWPEFWYGLRDRKSTRLNSSH